MRRCPVAILSQTETFRLLCSVSVSVLLCSVPLCFRAAWLCLALYCSVLLCSLTPNTGAQMHRAQHKPDRSSPRSGPHQPRHTRSDRSPQQLSRIAAASPEPREVSPQFPGLSANTHHTHRQRQRHTCTRERERERERERDRKPTNIADSRTQTDR